MARDRNYSVLIGRIEQAVQLAHKMELDLLGYVLQMALLEATEQLHGRGSRQRIRFNKQEKYRTEK